MLSVNIICIGKIKEKYWTDAISEYKKRLGAFCKFSIIELDEEKTFNNPNSSQIGAILNVEGKRIINALSKNSYVIPMCIEGKQLSSVELSEKLNDVSLGYSTIDFIIGGSWGLSGEVKSKSNFKLSMS